MVKEKVPSWEGKKKMFKDGDPDVFRGFNFQTWKNMTDGERAMWTEFSEVARAPIPKEVIDFKAKVKAANQPDGLTDPVSLEEWETKHKDRTRELGDEMLAKKAENGEFGDLKGKSAPIFTHNNEEAAKTLIKEELTERGIKFSHNSKLETLQKKLYDSFKMNADADNTE